MSTARQRAARVLPVLLRLGEVGPGDQLAHEQHVRALHDLRLQRREVHQRRLHARRAAGWRTCRAPRAGREWPARAARSAFGSSHFGPPTAPNSTASLRLARRERLVAQRRAIARRSPRRRPGRRSARSVCADARLDGPQHLDRLGDDLRPDPVAGQDREAKAGQPSGSTWPMASKTPSAARRPCWAIWTQVSSVTSFLVVGQVLEADERVVQLFLASAAGPALPGASRSAWRPECLPSTSGVPSAPMAAADMIS